MRIISGKLKGRILKSFDGPHIRPTTDRVKESMFNIMQGYFEGARVLDLFSGTGNLSFEAYSREASYVESVEKHPVSLKIIQENLDLLKITDGIRVVRQDVFMYLSRYNGTPFDVIFIDPPFTEAWADKVMQELSVSSVFHENSIIAIESSKKEKIEGQYNNLRAVDTRNFGDKILTLFKPMKA